MKKRILAALVSALILANITACNVAPEQEKETSVQTTAESFTDPSAEGDPVFQAEGTIPCNGVYRTSKVQFDINQKKELILYIEDWDESFVVPNEDMYFIAETVFSSSVVLGEDRGALVFRDFSPQPKPIKVIQFTKGNPQVTIKNLTFPATESYSFKYCNFIDEKTGYLFLFDGNNSHIQLTKLLKTVDGGQTWVEQSLNNIPAFYWKENIICAKMINEKVGLIAGSHYSDENFSRRTYVTADGGVTWSGIDILYPQNAFELGLGCEEACDILYEDGAYILICRFRSYGEDSSYSYLWVKYASTDLKTWTEVP